jgi:hypothetical protein
MGKRAKHKRPGGLFVAVCLIASISLALADDHEKVFTFEGAGSNHQLGRSVSGAGDVNGDGYDDVIVGTRIVAPGNSVDAGQAKVYSGEDGSVLLTLDGLKVGDGFGFSVSGAGDVNKDGYDDVIVGAPYFKDPLSGDQVGAAYVFSGVDRKIIHTMEGSDWRFGHSVSGAGDVNKDGYDDFIVGAPYEENNDGVVRVYSGKDKSLLDDVSTGGRCGWSVSGAGDVNKDGWVDYIVGAPRSNGDTTTQTGSAHVISGYDGEILHTVDGLRSYDHLGTSVSGAGDVNADGYDDFIVGAPDEDANGPGSGTAQVFSGKDGKLIRLFEGDTDNQNLGRSVCGVGDVDDDGYDDVMAGAPGTGTGMARVFSGKTWSTLYTWFGDGAGDRFGPSVSCAGDVNGDGVNDLIVGAWRDDNEGTDSGCAFVFASDPLTGTLTIDSGKEFTADTSVTLSLTWDDPITEMRLRAAGGTWSAWSDTAATKSWSLPRLDGDGQKTVQAQFRDDDGVVSEIVEGSIKLDQTEPKGELAIERGLEWTNSPVAHLELNWSDGQGSGVTHVRVRNQDGDWSDWVAVGTYVEWTLPPGDGLKIVHVEFKDAVGNVSDPVSDSISLDQTPPTGELNIEGGAEWVGTPEVTLEFTWEDAGSGVDDVQVRREGDSWDDWASAAATLPWTLATGDGWKTLEARLRDEVGNISETFSDIIGLDETPPDISIEINEGANFTATQVVRVAIEVDDHGGSGPAETRFRHGSTAVYWEDWVPFESVHTWNLTVGDGVKEVDVKVRDIVGNVSELARDSISLDQTPPVIEGFTVNLDRPYILPGERLELHVFAEDNRGGSGVGDCRVSLDDGESWSEWSPVVGSYADIARSDAEGLLPACIMVRDKVENESEVSEPRWIYLVEGEQPYLGAGAKFAGGVCNGLDVDALALDLVGGDILTVQVKGKALTKGVPLDLALDLVRPDGERLLLGRYPKDAKKVSIKGYEIPETGRYLLVVRREPTCDAEEGTYRLKAKVKQAKPNKKGKGEFTGTEILFDAVADSTLKAALKGEGLTPVRVTLVGPEGAVSFEAKGKNGKVAIKPVVLDAGTGTYAIRFDAVVTVSAKWSLKLPKIKGTVEE